MYTIITKIENEGNDNNAKKAAAIAVHKELVKLAEQKNIKAAG